jgi:hypothetical protein
MHIPFRASAIPGAIANFCKAVLTEVDSKDSQKKCQQETGQFAWNMWKFLLFRHPAAAPALPSRLIPWRSCPIFFAYPLEFAPVDQVFLREMDNAHLFQEVSCP